MIVRAQQSSKLIFSWFDCEFDSACHIQWHAISVKQGALEILVKRTSDMYSSAMTDHLLVLYLFMGWAAFSYVGLSKIKGSNNR